MYKKLARKDSLGWLIAVLSEQMKNELDTSLKKHGLNIGLWPTLFALWQEEGITQTELAKRCMTAHYTTTRTLDRMVSMGLVERHTDPESRRSFRIYLTKKGNSLEIPLTREAKTVNQIFINRLNKIDGEQLVSTLQKLVLDLID